MTSTFPAKLLLFGEHTVNLGSHALALPLPLFSGKWAHAPQLSPSELAARQQQLPQFADYLDDLQQRGELLVKLDISAFKKELQNGLVFESNIPMGYGAGSSGALVAGVIADYACLSADRDLQIADWGANLTELKKALAKMEAFFHGTSSGTDPLVCYLQKPVLLGGKEGAALVKLPSGIQPIAEGEVPKKGSFTIFLLDTSIQRSATPLIAYFMQQSKGLTLSSRIDFSLIPDVQDAIRSFLNGNSAAVYKHFGVIGLFQYKFLRGLIPVKYRKLWAASTESDLFKLKVCGAGGGGFILGMTKDWEGTKAALVGQKLIPVFSL
jgi:mevalonate kinase